MIELPTMILVGGNSRNSGKTTIACNIISKLSINQDVIGLKITGIRPGEKDFHGNHSEENISGFSIIEEVDSSAGKDTSRMLEAGARRVFYIRAQDILVRKAILHFISGYTTTEILVCESRNLRDFIHPGLFLMMNRFPVMGKPKPVAQYIAKADFTLDFARQQDEIIQFCRSLDFVDGHFCFSNSLSKA